MGIEIVIKSIIDSIKQVILTNFIILIQGETGTGKSYLAELIHKLSKRSDKQFIKIDIGALSENIIESELFGHEKGAFTGADNKKKGFFEVAKGGTLFIDEIENLPYTLQSKLLSVVGDKYFYTVGGSKALSMDVRLICASNHDLCSLKKENKFRNDLYYRLTEFVITIPPLRERREEIPFFVNKFLLDICDESNKPLVSITDSAMDFLTQQPWNGNIRELKNVIQRVVLMSNKNTITPDIIKCYCEDTYQIDNCKTYMPFKEYLKQQEILYFKRLLRFTNGNRVKAASISKVSYRHLLFKLKKYNIKD